MRKCPTAGLEVTAGWGLKSFSHDALEKIHAATLDVMQTTGLAVASDDALDILDKGGCWVNKKTQVVRFPHHLVNQAVDQAPSHVLLAARDPANDYMMGGKSVGFTNFGVGVLMEDLETGELRDSVYSDVEQIALVCDALDSVDVVTTPVMARDKPDVSYDLHITAACLTHSGKHYHGDAEDGLRVRQIIEMGAAVAGGLAELQRRPILSFGTCPTSPPELIKSCAEVIVESARHWIPIDVLSMAMGGASSPISVAGTLVTHNAEVLAGIVLAQTTNPGCPVMYGSSTTTFDMRHGTAVVGVPEMAMISAGAANLANFYGIPSYVAGT